MRKKHLIYNTVVILAFLLEGAILFAEQRVTLVEDTFTRSGTLENTTPETVASEIGSLTWLKSDSRNVYFDSTNGTSVTTGTGSASVLSTGAMLGKTLVISSDITLNTISGNGGTELARGIGLGFLGTLTTPTQAEYNRYGFSGLILYPGTSPAAGTVYYGTYNKSTNKLDVTTGNTIADFSNTQSYNLSYKIALSRDGTSAIISDVKIDGTAIFAANQTFTVSTNDTNGTGVGYLGYISSSGSGSTSGLLDNFKIEQSYGTVTSGNETKFNQNTLFDIKVTSGTTLNVAEYLNEQDINPASGEIYLTGKGWNNTNRIYLDATHPTNYTQIHEGAIVVGGLSQDRAIYPNIVIDVTEGATISKAGKNEAATGRLILKGNLTGGKLTTFGIRQASVTALDGDVALAGINVATGTLQFNSSSTKIDSKTIYLTSGVNVEKGAILALNQYGTFEIRTSKASNASLGTITLNDSTLKTCSADFVNWNLKANLTVNGNSVIDYGNKSYAIQLQGATLTGSEGSTLQLTNINLGGFILQNYSKFTGTMEFKGAYKLKFDSGSLMDGNLTVSGGTLHFADTSMTGMTTTSSITLKSAGALQIDNGKLQGTVSIEGGTLKSNIDFQSGTLTFAGTNTNNAKDIKMTGGLLVLGNNADLPNGTFTLNGGNLDGKPNAKLGTLVLSKDGTVSQSSAGTFYTSSVSATNNKLTYKPTGTSVWDIQNLNVQEFNYDCGGNRGVLNIRATATLGASGLTKTGTGTADFHLYDGATISLASGVTSSQIASGINTRLVGSTTFNLAKDQTLVIHSPIISTTGSTTQQLHKTGEGTLILNGTNTYVTTTDGQIYSTFVEEGTLVVNGSLADDVQILSNGILATGTAITPSALSITGTLDVSGTVALDLFDAGSDSITTTEGITFHEGSNLAIDLSGLTDTESRGYIDISGISTFKSDIPLATLVSVTGSTTNWTPILVNDRLVLASPNAIPEPATWALLLIGLGLLYKAKKK